MAVTPDGIHAISSAGDKTLRVWDLNSGGEKSLLTLESSIRTCAVVPDGLTLVAGDAGGLVHILPLENVTPDASIITAWYEQPDSLMVQCPLCIVHFEIEQSDQGSEIPCPNCGAALKVNPFTVSSVQIKKKGWQFWKK